MNWLCVNKPEWTAAGAVDGGLKQRTVVMQADENLGDDKRAAE